MEAMPDGWPLGVQCKNSDLHIEANTDNYRNVNTPNDIVVRLPSSLKTDTGHHLPSCPIRLVSGPVESSEAWRRSRRRLQWTLPRSTESSPCLALGQPRHLQSGRTTACLAGFAIESLYQLVHVQLKSLDVALLCRR